MICPYFKKLEDKFISCKRGHVKRSATFKAKHKRDKHIRMRCGSGYTGCVTYKRLQNDW